VEVLSFLEEAGLKESLHPERPEILAQVKFAVEREKALHLEDVMLRRLEIGYSAQRWGSAPEKASRLMAGLLNWDEPQRQKELENYRRALYPIP
jgi:glycerol-3-phosphate dehydrogenase